MKNNICILLAGILGLLTLLSCKDNKNPETPDGDPYNIIININLTDPEPSPFDITGEVLVSVSGEDVTFNGTYHIGELTYTQIVFKGKLTGNLLTMETDSVRVSYTSDNVIYTEDITWVLPPFAVTAEGGTGSGTIVAKKDPGGLVESGTFTFTVSKKE